MKIAQSVIRYHPAIGGVEDYVHNLSLRLQKAGNDITIVTSDLSHHQQLKRNKNKLKETIDGVDIVRNNVLPFNIKGYMFAPNVFKTLYNLNPDIIHAHSYMYSSADFGLLASAFRRKPLVFNPYLSGTNNPSLFGRFYRKVFGNLLFKAECIIAISPYEEQLIKSWGFSCKRIEQVSPGVDLKEFKEQSEESVMKKFNVKAKHKVLFVGRIDYMKGIDLLVGAAENIVKELDDICFVIAGPDFGYKKILEQMILEKNLEKYFKFTGVIERSDLVQMYKESDLFAFPSRYEAFGIVAAEAMAAKKAVVASDCSAIPEVVERNSCGLFFKNEDVNDFAEKVVYLLTNNLARTQMGDAGYKRVKEMFSWEESAKKLAEIYRTL